MRKSAVLWVFFLLATVFLMGCAGGGILPYSIAGRVLDGANQGVQGVEVRFSGIFSSAITDAGGYWTKSGLIGTVTVTPEKEGFSFAPLSLSVTGADTNVNFTAQRMTSSLEGRVNVVHRWPHSALEPQAIGQSLNVRRSSFSQAMDAGFEEWVPNQVLVGFAKDIRAFSLPELAVTYALTVLEEVPDLDVALMEFSPTRSVWDVIDDLRQDPLVLYAEPNRIRRAAAVVPNDEFYKYQWHYPQIRLSQAWSATTGSQAVRIAVLDTGVRLDHPDLFRNVDTSRARDFITNRPVYDANGHGTHVAGTIGAMSNNGVGVAGVMWNVTILPVKVLDDEGNGTDLAIANGILYAAGLLSNPVNNAPVDIINMSLGGEGYSTTIQNAVRRAHERGIILVAASGNSNTSMSNFYPAAHPEVIAVGATDLNYPRMPGRAPYSNFGNALDVVAPGGNVAVDTNADEYVDGVLSTWAGGEYAYRFIEGTSMATPHVSGVIGLMLSYGVPSSQVRGILTRTAMELGTPGFSPYFGHGLINAYWAVHGVDHVRILVGQRQGNTIHVVKETTVSLKGGSYSFAAIPSGTHGVYAWIDVRGNNVIEPGDYFAELTDGEFSFAPGQPYVKNGTVREVE